MIYIKRFLFFLVILFGVIINAQETNQETKYLTADDDAIPPMISGCKSKKTAEAIRVCFNKKFKKKLNRKLRASVFSSKNLSVGKHTIFTSFVISKKGEITKIDVKHSNENIVKEINRALKKFRKFKPALLNGKPVRVNYSFPIHIEVFE